MQEETWVRPREGAGDDHSRVNIDMGTPTVARMYDYLLDGKDNFDVDRQAASGLIEGVPEIVGIAKENRAFLNRIAHYLAGEAGIDQFIDLGSGLPTQDNLHQVAQRVNPRARVVYVDNDPIVLAHGRALLDENDATTVITADLTRPEDILTHPDVRQLIDFEQPVGVMFVAILHCIPDSADPASLVQRMLDVVPPGSMLALSHIVSEDAGVAAYLTDFMNNVAEWGRVRSPSEVLPYFDGLELIEPGLVDVRQWRTEPPVSPDHEGKLWELGGIGRKL